MKVSMLVHNGVISDARVIKQAKTLSSHGYEVEIHGISAKRIFEELLLPGTDIKVFLVPPAIKQNNAVNTNYFVLKLFGLAKYVGKTLKKLLPIILYKFLRKSFFTACNTCSLLLDILKFKKTKSDLPLAGKYIYNRYSMISQALYESLLSQKSPDVVHIHDHIALLAAPSIKAKFNCPIVWDAHEIYTELSGLEKTRKRVNQYALKQNIPFIDSFITINDSIAQFYKINYKISSEIVVIKNATMPSAEIAYDGRLHEAAQLEKTQKILLYQGGFSLNRGLIQLMEAAPLLNDDWTLVMMGSGSLEEDLRDICSKNPRNSVNPAVVFLPPAPHIELKLWTQGATLGIIPYENIGLNHLYCTPNKLWEYPDANVPFIATDLVEIGNMLRQSGAGFLIATDFNARDIAELVNQLSEDDINKAKRACLDYIKNDNWAKYSNRLLNLYSKIQVPYNVAA